MKSLVKALPFYVNIANSNQKKGRRGLSLLIFWLRMAKGKKVGLVNAIFFSTKSKGRKRRNMKLWACPMPHVSDEKFWLVV